MKLKTNNAAKKSVNKNKSPNKQAKGVEARKDKSKVVVKPTVLRKEAAKAKVEAPPSPLKALQKELWNKALVNVSNMTDLSEEESSIVKLLAEYKTKSSIPQKSTKLKNFITKGFSKYKDTSEDVLDSIYNKIFNEFKVVGGNAESINSKKSDSKAAKPKSKKEVSIDEEDADDNDDEVEVDDEAEGIVFGDSDGDDDDDDIENDEEESEDEKPKPKAKGNKAINKNGKSPNKGKNGSKFKGGKVQKNKKFNKKK